MNIIRTLCVFLFCTHPLFAQVIENNSFEDAAPDGVQIEGWGNWGEKLERVHVTEWAPVLHGDWMLAYKHWEKENTDDSGIFQDAKEIEAGHKYRFSIWIFCDAPEWGSLPREVELRIESMLEGEITTVASETFHPSDLETNRWVELSVSGIAPTDHLRVLLAVKPSDHRGGAIKFDSASLERAP